MSSLAAPFEKTKRKGLPRSLGYARKLTLEGKASKTDTAHVKVAEESPWTAAQRTAVLLANSELRLALGFGDHGLFSHVELPYLSAKGIPSAFNSARPSSSVLAVVTNVMFMPVIR